MFSQKPEFIDPEDGKLNYYYNRKEKENGLAKNNNCCSKKHFLVFHSSKGRFFLIVFYLFIVVVLFLFSHIRQQNFIGKNSQLTSLSSSLSGYYIESKKTYYLQILFKNQDKKAKNITILEGQITLFDSKNNIIAEKEIIKQKFLIKEKGIYALKIDILTTQKPHSIKAILKDEHNKEDILRKYLN